MNKIKIIILGILVSININGFSQTFEDALRYSQTQSTGTARSVGMGNAFSSLGGDYSSLSLNPAGIGTYRSSEFTITPSLVINSTETNAANSKFNSNKTTFIVNQIGYVNTFRPMQEDIKNITSVHFAVGYSRKNNFNFESNAIASNITNSMTDRFLLNAEGRTTEDLYNSRSLPYSTYLINPTTTNGVYTNNLSANSTLTQISMFKKEGSIGTFDIVGGINISNKLQLGASMNIFSLNYIENYYYTENNTTPEANNNPKVFKNFTLHDYLEADGSGINLKLGVIFKPIDQLRIGLSYHSPNWYNIQEKFNSRIDANFFNPIASGSDKGKSYLYDETKIFDSEYSYRTPSKWIGGISYVISKLTIVSFDYEHIDYANSKYNISSANALDMQAINTQNDLIKETFKAVNNYRVGLEIRLNNAFSVRGGYIYKDSPFKKINPESNLFNKLSEKGTFTAPENYKTTIISGGIGYKFKNYFIDLAYRNSMLNYSYYNYFWPPTDNNIVSKTAADGILPVKTKVSSTNHYALVTLGLKF